MERAFSVEAGTKPGLKLKRTIQEIREDRMDEAGLLEQTPTEERSPSLDARQRIW